MDIEEAPPAVLQVSKGSEIMHPLCITILDIEGKVMVIENLGYPSYFVDWAMRIWGVDTVNVARCLPEVEGLYGWSFAVVHVRTYEVVPDYFL